MGDDINIIVTETAKSMGQPTIAELIDNIVEQRGIKPKDATKAVYIEYKKGNLDLTQPNPPSNITSYFLNLESAWFWATTALVAITLIVVFTVNASLLIYVRYVLGGVFILFLPGFMLISALYPRKEMDELERIALSIGLSLAIVPLIGLALNYTPWGIRLEPIMISLSLFTEILAVAIVIQRFRYFQLNQNTSTTHPTNSAT